MRNKEQFDTTREYQEDCYACGYNNYPQGKNPHNKENDYVGWYAWEIGFQDAMLDTL